MKPTRFILAACSSIVLLSGLAACALTYRTPGAEAVLIGDLAVIEFSDDRAMGTIVAVDGAPRADWNVHRYELTPGPHVVRMDLNAGISVATLELSFSVLAGHEYRLVQTVVNADQKSAIAKVVVVDKQTGQEIPRDVRLLGLARPPAS